MDAAGRTRARLLGRFLLASLAGTLLLAVIDTAAASNAAVSLSNAASGNDLDVPRWLYVMTGGATIGASAVLASFVTDRRFIERAHESRVVLPSRGVVRRWAVRAARGFGLVALAYVVWQGFAGPQVPTVNAAVILVFAGVRAGLTMFAYLVADPWPALNPWRTLAQRLPSLDRPYPERLGRWPAVVGFLALIWIETTTAVNAVPAMLSWALVGYTAVTLAGTVVFSPATWFRYGDPVAVAFRFYGAVAPLRWTDGGLSLRPPGFRLPDSDLVDGRDDVAFVVALVWELTFTGFVTTSAGAVVVRSIVGGGVPPLAVYALLFVGGYAAFLAAYRYAARRSRRVSETYLPTRTLLVRFAPPLLAIAAGYHLAHYFTFFVTLTPRLADVLASPLSPAANPVVLTVPWWFGALPMTFVLIGHLLSIWLAHTTAYGTFPARMQAIRSQFPFVAVMIGYTVVSLWLLSLPTTAPPFLGGG
ncbi:hypothetical protein ACFQPA_01740 [Halomarina halobia]|uniref:Fenitrothion hydrolase n=1 Tax=Halomarina halobia TaxID=3033386 RepID=A0ABD6A880_9EURY|nr:hypothetical protein [Halomarina sp. PSR21]